VIGHPTQKIAFVAGPKRSTTSTTSTGTGCEFIYLGRNNVADATAQTEPVRLWDMNPLIDSNESWATWWCSTRSARVLVQ
jgi:hypothetical protein